jgi:hypothetical protein
MAKLLSGNSRAQEMAIQQRMMRRGEITLARALYAEIYRAMREYGDYHGNPGKQAEAIYNHKLNMTDLLTSMYTRIWSSFGRRTLTGGLKCHEAILDRKRYDDVDAVPITETFDKIMREWAWKHATEKVTPIANTTQKQAAQIIRAAVDVSVREGLGEIPTAKLISEGIAAQGGDLSQFRSRMIARTEMHSAAMASSQASAEVMQAEFDMVVVKEWSAAFESDRSRMDHREMDGKSVGLKELFTLPSGEQLMYPGDPSGSAREIINCRCVALHVVQG